MFATAVSTDTQQVRADVARFRVLCVDDNHDVADSTALLLQIVGFDAVACYDGHSALDTADDFLPGMCLLDLNMPGMAGDVLAARLRAWAADRKRPVVLVAMTAADDTRGRGRVRDAGFDLHLVKPVDPFNLVRIVNKLWDVWSKAAADMMK